MEAAAEPAQEEVNEPQPVVEPAPGQAEAAAADAKRSYEVEDTAVRNWFRVQGISVKTGFPPIVRRLLETQVKHVSREPYKHQRIRVLEFLRALSHVLAVESGLVPMLEDKPLRSADEVMAMPIAVRMITLIRDLIKIAEAQETLRKVLFRYIVDCSKTKKESNSTPPQAHSQSEPPFALAAEGEKVPTLYKYSDKILANVLLRDRTDGFRVGFGLENSLDSIRLPTRDVFKHGQVTDVHTYFSTPAEVLSDGIFDACRFAHSIKEKLLKPFISVSEAVDLDYNRMDLLPDDVVIEMAKRMDCHTFLTFSTTNRRVYNLVRHNEEIWKALVERIDDDLREYRILIPSSTSISRKMRDVSHQQRYRMLYNEGLDMLNRALPRSARRLVYYDF